MSRLTEQQLERFRASGRVKGDPPSDKPKKSKHRNVKTEVDGIIFDSGKEAKRYQELKLLERAGQITDLMLQVAFQIVPAVTLYGRKVPARHYVADFVYTEAGKQVVEDSKGQRLPMYTLKRQLMKAVHNIEIKET